MKETQTHAWSPAGEEAVAYSLARRKAAAVTRESVEVAACFLARERRRRQSHDMAHVLGPRRTPDHGCFIAMACVAFADVTDTGAHRQKCLATALDNNGYRVSR